MQGIFAAKRTKVSALVVITVLPALLAVYTWFLMNREALPPVKERDLWDILVANSDLVLAVIFLLVSVIPFFLVFDGRKPQARELIPIAVMAALGVVGRTAFQIVPLPNFKPVSAIVIITAVSFGPETGFLTGALTAFVSNFIFGQGPWTPWQMFTWGIVGFVAGVLNNLGLFKKKPGKKYFKGKWFSRVCPPGTSRGDLLEFARSISSHGSMSLCVYGLLSGFLYGWIINLYQLVTYVGQDAITWSSILAIYVSSFFFDLSHGVCTFLVLWAVSDPWIRKLDRVKVKYGLVAQHGRYEMPPGRRDHEKKQGNSCAGEAGAACGGGGEGC